MPPGSPPARSVLLGLALAVLVGGVYAGAIGHDFVNFDDNIYVTTNPMVQLGITGESLRWAFTSGHATNWHPLTWISHMADIELFGLDPRGHHATAIFLHVVNSVLLWGVLWFMTGALWRSWAVAALFGLHPLHVESVAWVAERKDVLSTLFFLLTLWAYARVVRKPRPAAWALVLVFYACGLMSKPMLITLPALLLVLDFWPLGRWRPLRPVGKGMIAPPKDRKQTPPVPLPRLLLEKVPFLALAVVSSIVTYLVQSRGGAVTSADTLPLAFRAGNGVVSYFRYLGKMVWPVDLAVFYPHPGLSFAMWKAVLAFTAVAAISVLAVREARRRPYFLAGWLWYLGTLVPVLGLVQAGAQSMADRYTYIPLIGIFVVLVWAAADLMARRPSLRMPVLVGGLVIGVICSALTVRQVGFWENSITLFNRTAQVTGPNWMAEQNLGFAHGQAGNHAAALPHYETALRLRPGLSEVHRALGISLAAVGRPEEAFENYEEAIRLDPLFAEAHYDYAVTLAGRSRLEDAVRHYREALRIDPGFTKAYNNLGVALAMLGRPGEALDALTRAREAAPGDPSVHNNLGNLAATQGRMDEAVRHWREALRLDPGNVEARRNLEQAGVSK